MHAERLDTLALLEMAKEIVIAEVSHNPVAPDALPGLIERVYQKLVDISGSDASADRTGEVALEAELAPRRSAAEPAMRFSGEGALAPAGAERPSTWPGREGPRGATAREDGREPAVPRDRSVHPDFIVCLFDGVKRKMLKRHIKTRYGMSPESYRHYWELADDYPMTAPNYADEKRDYALSTGFGLGRRQSAGRGAA
jgi:predicted transcriptional regulator